MSNLHQLGAHLAVDDRYRLNKDGWSDAGYGYGTQQTRGDSNEYTLHPDEDDDYVLPDQGRTPSDKHGRRRGQQSPQPVVVVQDGTPSTAAASWASRHTQGAPNIELTRRKSTREFQRDISEPEETPTAASDALASRLAGRLDLFLNDTNHPWHHPWHQGQLNVEEPPSGKGTPQTYDYDLKDGGGEPTNLFTPLFNYQVQLSMSDTTGTDQFTDVSDYVHEIFLAHGSKEVEARALFDTGNKLGHMVSLKVIHQLGLDERHLDGKPRKFYPVGSRHAIETLGGLKLEYDTLDDQGYLVAKFQVVETLVQGYDVLLCGGRASKGTQPSVVAATIVTKAKPTAGEREVIGKGDGQQSALSRNRDAKTKAILEKERMKKNAERLKKKSGG